MKKCIDFLLFQEKMLFLLLLFAASGCIQCSQVLVPPDINIAVDKAIHATATCGEMDDEPYREVFCQIAGSSQYTPLSQYSYNTGVESGGQVCDYCEANTTNEHPARFMVDGRSTWWQSPPLSRGKQYEQINITIDLGQEFHVAYVWIQMANSPRPAKWVLEKSVDYGKTYKPWQYFAESYAECQEFGQETLEPILRDDSVICTTEFSNIAPLENGEMMIKLLEKRPGRGNFSHSEVLQEFAKATNIRLRLLRTKTLHGHLINVQKRKDPSVTRRHFYAIKEIFMGGRCVCNGHASSCDVLDPKRSHMLLCRCEHNTCGDQCEKCCPGFEQKEWRRAKDGEEFHCEPCNCHGHSDTCVYEKELSEKHLSLDIYGRYEGGGRCLNCQDHTEGINCNKCVVGYYRPYGKSWSDIDACQPCQCNPRIHSDICEEETGQCHCKPQFTGPNCDHCSPGYYSPPQCLPCECSPSGTEGKVCLPQNGQCPCKPNYTGQFCDECSVGFTNKTGVYCNCDPLGAEGGLCDGKTGTCLCKPGYVGNRCDQCDSFYYGYPNCEECNCDPNGSEMSECELKTGECTCRRNFIGRRCDRCKPGYYGYPNCKACDCHVDGSEGLTCDNDGKVVTFCCYQCVLQCFCKPSFQGDKCNECKPNFYNFPLCEECRCDPSGVSKDFGGCDKAEKGKLCECKKNVEGRICNRCKPTFWGLNYQLEDGCQSCNCHPSGTVEGLNVCDLVTGQCQCKEYAAGRDCSICAEGYYNLQQHNIFGCQPCNCNKGGSIGIGCDIHTGQCYCRPRVTGLKCDQPIADHYIPTLWHNKYEAEDGRTIDGDSVRYASDAEKFTNFSSKGFAVFSETQDEILLSLNIHKSTLYQILFVYVNPTPVDAEVDVTVVPSFSSSQTFSDAEQTVSDILPSSNRPAVRSVNKRLPFALNPGVWTLHIKVPKRVFLDYVTLLPSEYYEADLLKDVLVEPCKSNDDNKNCIKTSYPPLPYSSRACISSYQNDIKVFSYMNLYASKNVPEDGDYFLVLEYNNSAPVVIHTEIASVCTMKNGECIEQTYPLAVNELVREAKAGPNSAKAIEIKKSINIESSVSGPGKYVFIVHYYNLDNGLVKIPVYLNTDTFYDCVLNVEYCPNKAGCRAVIQDIKRNYLPNFDVSDKFEATLNYNSSQKGPVYINSIIAIPVQSYSDSLLKLQPVDASEKFIRECGDDEFKNAPSNVSQFCRDNVFALTTDFNSASFPCYCSHEGSKSFSCEKYGGQCLCRPNIIGRQCDQCEPGYYDFPYCRKCNCLIGQTCNQHTGQCYCPRYVEGQMCDRCVQYAYGYDPLIGCQLCQCHPEGLDNEYGSAQCDSNNGQCLCKTNVGGRRCDQCLSGYYGFPHCYRCACDQKGTTDNICDSQTSECICKENVEGSSCDRCKPGMFNLEESNSLGCSECFCFGATDRCVSSSVSVGYVSFMIFTNMYYSATPDEIPVVSYYKVPITPGSDFTSSYGLTVSLSLPNTGSEVMSVAPDLKLVGNNKTLEYWIRDPPTNLDEPYTIQLKLIPENFIFDNGAPVKRSDLMLVLVQLDEILVKGSYYESTNHSSLTDFLMETGKSSVNGDGVLIATSVEICECPTSYTGNSCQYCADGYYRVKTGAYLGACVACDCNGHSGYCDKETGVCVDCQDHTHGDHCELCEVGYYGDATRGIYGCLPCQCPSIYNNFAVSCQVDNHGNLESCTCQEGYTGERCDRCGNGYFGEPSVYGGHCTKCSCNNNNDLTLDGSCNPADGQCDNCLNHTAGDHCELCEEWYFGDAIEAKNCTDCGCNRSGSQYCDKDSGKCLCKPNVESETCDRCDNAWGLNRGIGCDMCNCGEASQGEQCDNETGQCACMPGAAGMRCETCDHGYWNYTSDGCTKCDCEADLSLGTVCDIKTGNCHCQKGATGPRCDQCLISYLRIPDYGCRMCDECVLSLVGELDVVDAQQGALDYAVKNMSPATLAGARLTRLSKNIETNRVRKFLWHCFNYINFAIEFSGLILFYGDEDDGNESDYVTLTLKDGMPYLTVGLGDKPSVISLDKKVNDDDWWKITGERTGRKLIITAQKAGTLKSFQKSEDLGGKRRLLDVHNGKGKLFVGGIPDQVKVHLEMVNGIIQLKFNLGSGELKLSLSNKTYNDGRWHTVDVNRRGRRVRLTVDKEFVDAESGGDSVDLNTDTFLCCRKESIPPFRGCVKEVKLNSHFVDLNKPNATKNVKQGCSYSFASTVSFSLDESRSSFANIDLGNISEIIFISLNATFYDGVLTVASIGRQKIGSKPLSDGRWHFVAIKKAGDQVDVEVDDNLLGNVPVSDKLFKVSFLCFIPLCNYYNTVTSTTTEPVVQHDLTACALSSTPLLNTDDNRGQRFGLASDSRLEYNTLSTSFDMKSIFTVQIRPSGLHGLIMLSKDRRNVDYISLYMVNGSVNFAFNAGHGAVILRSKRYLLDGKWHDVIAERYQRNGTLYVDGNMEDNGLSPVGSVSINSEPPLYIGGLPKDINLLSSITKGLKPTFVGCMRNFTLNGVKLDNPEKYNLAPCSEGVEKGTYFGGKDGYVILHRNFITNNGKTTTVSSTLTSSNDLCDGHWHSIKVFLKRDFVQTRNDVYIALIYLSYVKFFLQFYSQCDIVCGSYVGCIRYGFKKRTKRMKKDLEFSDIEVFGDVNTSSCLAN
uniref:Laminin subunit alpha n=1 Tax=Syphacia muris TaxID=451379 RepID=A0A0N5ARB5_9BILA